MENITGYASDIDDTDNPFWDRSSDDNDPIDLSGELTQDFLSSCQTDIRITFNNPDTDQSFLKRKTIEIYRNPVILVIDTEESDLINNLSRLNTNYTKLFTGTVQMKVSGFTKCINDLQKNFTNRSVAIPSQICDLIFFQHNQNSDLEPEKVLSVDLILIVVDIMTDDLVLFISYLVTNQVNFIIVLSKIEQIKDWEDLGIPIEISWELQKVSTQDGFDEKIYSIQDKLLNKNIYSAPHWEYRTKKKGYPIVPISSETGEGCVELIQVILSHIQHRSFNKLIKNDEFDAIFLGIDQDWLAILIINGSLFIGDTVLIKNNKKKYNLLHVCEMQTPAGKKVTKVTASTVIRIQGPNDKINYTDYNLKIGTNLQIVDEDQLLKASNMYQEIGDPPINDNLGVFLRASNIDILSDAEEVLKQYSIPIIGRGVGPLGLSEIRDLIDHSDDKPIRIFLVNTHVEKIVMRYQKQLGFIIIQGSNIQEALNNYWKEEDMVKICERKTKMKKKHLGKKLILEDSIYPV